MRVLVALSIVLAGCAGVPPEPVSEAPFGLPTWQEGDYWVYDADGQSITLIWDGSHMVADSEASARVLAAAQAPLLGIHSNGAWSDMGRDYGPFGSADFPVSFQWLSLEASEAADETRRAPATSEASHTIQDDTLYLDGVYAGNRINGTYRSELGWFESIIVGKLEMHLVEQGSGWSGERWVGSSPGSYDSVVLGSTFGIGTPRARDAVITYTLDCANAGASYLRFGTSRPIIDPIIAYQDTCPGQRTQVDTISWDADALQLEADGFHGDVNQLYGATYHIQFLVIEQR